MSDTHADGQGEAPAQPDWRQECPEFDWLYATLCDVRPGSEVDQIMEAVADTAAALRAAPVQQQEPEAWRATHPTGKPQLIDGPKRPGTMVGDWWYGWTMTPLYAAPPAQAAPGEREQLIRDVIERCAQVADAATRQRSGYTGDSKMDRERDISAQGAAATVARWIREGADAVVAALSSPVSTPAEEC